MKQKLADFGALVVLACTLMLVFAALAQSQGWAISPSMRDTGFWGSIVGAIVGGGIAILGQWITIIETRTQNQNEVERVRRGQAISLLFKFTRIYSNFANINEYFEECLHIEPKRRKLVGEPWMFFRPLASVPENVHFSAEEMALLLELADESLFEKSSALDTIHNGFLASLSTLSRQRTEFSAQLAPDNVVGDMGSGTYHISQQQRLEMNVLNRLIERLRVTCIEDAERSGSIVDASAKLFRDRLQLKINVSRKHTSIKD